MITSFADSSTPSFPVCVFHFSCLIACARTSSVTLKRSHHKKGHSCLVLDLSKKTLMMALSMMGFLHFW